MPAGAVGPSTVAASNVVAPAYLGSFPLSTSSLLTGTNVLAVEVHQGPARANKVLFGADLAVTITNFLFPPPITIAFNEVSSATNADFWIELVNSGTTSIDLGGCVLARQGGATNREHVFPSHTLAPRGMEVVTKAALGFGADPGDRLFLYGPGRSGVIDAIVAKRDPRGRWPDGTGQWCFPGRVDAWGVKPFCLSRRSDDQRDHVSCSRSDNRDRHLGDEPAAGVMD